MANKKTYELSDDSLYIYLKDIGQYKLLSENEEKKLFLQFKSGDKLAKNKLINSNLRLVYSIAKRYQFTGNDLFDIIQEGNKGLIIAANKYDCERNNRFTTFAKICINQSIIDYLHHNMNIGYKKYKIIIDIKHYIEEYLKTTGKSPNSYDLSDKFNLKVAQINQLLQLINYPLSLDMTSDDCEDSLLNCIPCQDDIFDLIAEKSTKEELIKGLNKLKEANPKIFNIIVYRYGLFNNYHIKLKDLSLQYGVSIQCISNMEKKGLKILRSIEEIKRLRIR